MKKYKLLITDLDGTLIETLSGDTFPSRVFTILGKNFIINIFSEPIIASKRSNSLAFIRIIAVRGIIS